MSKTASGDGRAGGTGGGGELELLVVDDEAVFRDLVVDHLEQRFPRATIHAAPDAEAGMHTLRTGSVDCIVSDYQMPGRDGLEFLRVARDLRPDVAFILFTSKGSEEVASEAISAGVTDYVQKGGDEQYELLANRIEQAVETGRRDRELAATKSRFDALTQNTAVAVVTVDASGTVTFASDGVAGLFGYDPDTLVGGSLDHIIPDHLVEDHHGAFERYLATGERTLDWDWTELPAEDAEGDPVPVGITFGETTTHGERLFTGVLRDLSDRRARETELARVRGLLEAAPTAIARIDEEGRIAVANRSLAALTGTDTEELVGRPAGDVLDVPDMEDVLQRLRGGDVSTETVRTELATPDRRVACQVTLRPLDVTGEADGVVAVVREQ